MNPEHYQVTEWSPKDEIIFVIIDSQKMRVQYDQWLGMEVDRWAAKEPKREAWLREDKATGMVALFSWRKYMKAVAEE